MIVDAGESGGHEESKVGMTSRIAPRQGILRGRIGRR